MTTSQEIHARFFCFKGKVTRIGLRKRLASLAQVNKIDGWVANLKSDVVLGFAQGESSKVKEFISTIKDLQASMDDTEVSFIPGAEQDVCSFAIKTTSELDHKSLERDLGKKWAHLGVNGMDREEAEEDKILYSRYIKKASAAMKKQPWWRYISSKEEGKSLARKSGVPVPFDLRDRLVPFVIKPVHGHSSKGVHCFENLDKFVVEQLMVDEDGMSPPRDFRFYFFAGECKMVHVSRPGVTPKLSGYYSWPDWKPLKIDRKRPWFDCEKPSSADRMHEFGKRLASHFPLPIRTDFYAHKDGAVFGEFCFSPGLAVGKRITEEGDRMLGEWYHLAVGCTPSKLRISEF